jgi:pyruvate formate lyase activating enzyme
MKKALLSRIDAGKMRCLTCERKCLLCEGGKGFCGTRMNVKGKLFTNNYGNISSLQENPIEKKPFFHFHPGSVALTAGGWGCNFLCPWCQNWEISKHNGNGSDISPSEFVEMAHERCRGTSVSFNEPTLLLEWSCDVFSLARKRGLYNTIVTNGYMTGEALRCLIESGLDAANIDIKGDTPLVRRYCGADVEHVWRNCRMMKRDDIHIEITTLVIPSVNDGEPPLHSIAERIVEELGCETPWHISSYFPAYKFRIPPTPLSTLEKAYLIGRNVGLKYVYLGNVAGHQYENTYCPSCHALLIRRFSFRVIKSFLRDGKCEECGEVIRGVWK